MQHTDSKGGSDTLADALEYDDDEDPVELEDDDEDLDDAENDNPLAIVERNQQTIQETRMSCLCDKYVMFV